MRDQGSANGRGSQKGKRIAEPTAETQKNVLRKEGSKEDKLITFQLLCRGTGNVTSHHLGGPQQKPCLWVLLFSSCTTNYHRLSSLKQHPFIISRVLSWVLCSWSHRAAIRVLARLPSGGCIGEESAASALTQVVVRIHLLVAVWPRPRLPAGHLLGAVVCSQSLLSGLSQVDFPSTATYFFKSLVQLCQQQSLT